MEQISLFDVVQAVNGSYGYPSAEMINDVSTDTRTIKEGSLFVALKGENFDGHDYVLQAMEKGAIAAITEKMIDGAKCIIVDDTSRALLDFAAFYRQKFTPYIVGVTGSVGKTTTKEMIFSVLSSKFITLKTEGNFNNEIGLPRTLMNLTTQHQAAVIEMGMSNAGEISRLSLTTMPEIAVITNIGFSHIESLGSQKNILKAKLEILDGTNYSSPLIACGDDELLFSLKDTIPRKIIFYGIENKANDVFATNIVSDGETTTFTINYGDKKIDAKLYVIGSHNILNALAAYVIGVNAGLSDDEIVTGLASFRPEGLRQTIKDFDGKRVVVDCYNASPDSMKASIKMLSEMKIQDGGRRIAVLGDMLELGIMSKNLHEKVGVAVAESKVDMLLCYGTQSAHISQSATKKGHKQVKHFDDRDELVEFLKKEVTKKDITLFKASRGMKFEELIEKAFK